MLCHSFNLANNRYDCSRLRINTDRAKYRRTDEKSCLPYTPAPEAKSTLNLGVSTKGVDFLHTNLLTRQYSNLKSSVPR